VQVMLLNLVLDALTNAYMEYAEGFSERAAKNQVFGIKKAFSTLKDATKEDKADEDNEDDDDEASISQTSFIDFIQVFSHTPNVRSISEETAEIMFHAVDKDKGGTIDESEFCELCSIVQYQFWTTVRNNQYLERSWLWEEPVMLWLRWLVWGKDEDDEEAPPLDGLMTWVLAANAGLVIAESAYDLHNVPEPAVLSLMENTFSMLYVFEVSSKLLVKSAGEYFSFTSNKFDFFTTWLLLGTSLMQEEGGAELSRYANVLRLLRLLRVLKQLKGMPSVQFMMTTVSKLTLASVDIFTLLGVVVFLFTTLSVQMFGGLLGRDNPRLAGTEYEKKTYYVLNFNDVPSAFGVWVVCLLCEYVPEFAEAVHNTSGIWLAWYIFPIFYVCGVSIVFELVKAFTIEVFISLHEEHRQEACDPDEAPDEFESLKDIKQTFDKMGKRIHYKAVGDLTKQKKVIEAFEEMEKEEKEEEEEEEEEEQEEEERKERGEKEDEGSEFEHV